MHATRSMSHLGFPLLLVGVLEGAHAIHVAPRVDGKALFLQRPQGAILAVVRRGFLREILERRDGYVPAAHGGQDQEEKKKLTARRLQGLISKDFRRPRQAEKVLLEGRGSKRKRGDDLKHLKQKSTGYTLPWESISCRGY